MKGEFRVWLPDFEEDFDLVSYFNQVEQAIEGQPRWRLHRDKITLGLFQFGKFQMYTDLDPTHWPDSEYGPKGKLIHQLLGNGFQSDAQYIEDISEHKYINTPEALHLIKDADSSQLEATLAIMEGASLVVQGPPGTGKSQTITNVIAEAVARGKKVLFVAQKMAALEVVKLRLDEAHLGDAVLELHSHKSSKPAVLESLRTVFQQGKPVSPDRSLEYQRLAASRSRLNDYVMAISQPILQSEVNFVEALGRMLQNQTDPRLALRQWRNDPAVLSHWLDYSYFSGLVDEAYAASPAIGRFDRLTHERLIQEFAELDKASFSYAQETLVAKLHADLPNLNAPGEMDVLRREFSKKRRHIPIRRLLGEAGTVIQQAKPIFMMSPMSVSTYLPQGQIDFDLVIFDEASQIPAPEALGAIMRGKQVVVVGDSKQMPPTSFFSRSIEMDDETAEQSATADVESILELMLSRGAPERMLRWHYRSRHESLIAVSNHQFYNNRLLVFPGPGTNVHATGLHFHHLPHTHYDRGGSRTNLGEAQAVAQAVLAHIRTKPQQSLGVVAFSMAQREAIMLEVERLRRQHPETEDYFRYHAGSDEFFIKNLENVQGDERDTIFISIGYGRTQAGNLSMGFGPINTKGGERRLNVLISRSVLSMEVFCNFTADDLNTTASSPFGVRALKVFLKYAETGMMPVSEETHREPDSPFELEVKHAIEQLGYEVQPQVGSQGFYLDLAVRDPSKPGRYVLAVECDGASYHSSMAARDRDRLRQSVLEGLGWRFHRIWSTEWFRNSGAEVVRLQEAIEAAIAHQQHLDSQEVDITPPLIEASIPTVAKPEITRIETTLEVLTVAPYEQVDPVTLPLPYVNDF